MSSSPRKLSMVDLVSQYRAIETEILDEVRKVMEAGTFINGPAVAEFARALKNYLDAGTVVTCANGTDALQIALMTLGLAPGAKVVVPAFTYIATVEVIALLGLRPIFVDVDPATFNMDPEKLQEVVSDDVSAIIAVHLFGQSADMEKIQRIAGHIPVIEDNAQALGSVYSFSDGRKFRTGTMGSIGCTSFFPSKNLGAFGDGGAMTFMDTELAEKARMIANHGQSRKYYHDIVGVNSRLDTLQAAILNVKLRHLDEYARKRNEVASHYDRELADLGLRIPFRMKNSSHVFHQYTVQVPDGKRDGLKEYLSGAGIPSMIYYPLPQHLQKAYLHYGFKEGDFPVSEGLCKEVLSLPIHTEMQEYEMSYICDTIKAYFHE